MNKALKIALIILIPLLLAVGGFIILSSQNGGGGGIVNNITNLFPGGGDDPTGPDDNGENGDMPDNGDDDYPYPDTPDTTLASRKISVGPVSGFTVLSSGGDTVVRYMEREKGNIYDYSFTKNTSGRISNKTIIEVEKVFWGVGGNTFITRSTDEESLKFAYHSFGESQQSYVFVKNLQKGDTGTDVLELQRFLNQDPATLVSVSGIGSPGNETTYFGPATEVALIKFQNAQALTETDGKMGDETRTKINSIVAGSSNQDDEDFEPQTSVFSKNLSPEISSIIISPEKNKIFYSSTIDGITSGYVANLDETAKTKVFSSPLSSWLALWPTQSTIVVTTKPSEDVPGYAYTLKSSGGTFGRLLGDIEGLTVLPNSSLSSVLFGTKSPVGNGFSTHVYNVSDNEKKVLLINTLPEKCVWSNNRDNIAYCAAPKDVPIGTYPDDWYKGRTSFNDAIWEVNTETGEQDMVFDPLKETLSMEIDVMAPKLDKDESNLIFINKKDLSLWSVELK